MNEPAHFGTCTSSKPPERLAAGKLLSIRGGGESHRHLYGTLGGTQIPNLLNRRTGLGRHDYGLDTVYGL
jgi:hypothetical protein